MWPSTRRRGYALVEIIVALMLFSVGGLALTSTAAVLARQLATDARRERAALAAATRLETLRAGCAGAASGREVIGDIASSWSISRAAPGQVSVVELVTYLTMNARRTDTLRAILPCG